MTNQPKLDSETESVCTRLLKNLVLLQHLGQYGTVCWVDVAFACRSTQLMLVGAKEDKEGFKNILGLII